MSRNSGGSAFAWALWDWALQPFATVITSFVFTVYLTSYLFFDNEAAASDPGSPAFESASATLSGGLGIGIAIAGTAIAVIAPLLGRLSDARGRRKAMLAVSTGLVAVMTALMFFVEPSPDFFVLGVVLLAVATVASDLAFVPYNALLSHVSTRENRARVGAFGWGAGYLGGILVMLIAYVGFIAGEPYWFGTSETNSTNIRAIALVCAVWIVVFSIPLFIAVREPAAPASAPTRLGILRTYRELFGTVRRLHRDDRSAFWLLISSAIYRDGLAGVFVFGGVIASVTFGFSFTEVLIFGVMGNVIAGVSTIASGWVEQRWGSIAVIRVSLAGVVVLIAAMVIARDAGAIVFWVCGLGLTVFVGPAQSASRTLLSSFAPASAQGEFFGLYATTGRIAGFLTPTLWALLITAFGAQYWGGVALVLVVAVGLALFLLVKPRAGSVAAANSTV